MARHAELGGEFLPAALVEVDALQYAQLLRVERSKSVVEEVVALGDG